MRELEGTSEGGNVRKGRGVEGRGRVKVEVEGERVNEGREGTG